MAVIVAMLRGVNVGGHNRVPMEELRKLCASLKLREAQTYVQSGNVIFTTEEKDFVALAKRMTEGAIAKKFGFPTDVVFCLSMGGRRICTFRMVWGGRRCLGRRFRRH
jgi:uncharacterized protein (DUF1697 family)